MLRFALLTCFLASAATAQPGNYVILASGDTLRGRVEVRSPLLQRTYVRVDSQRYELEALQEIREGESTLAVVEGRRLAELVRRGDRVDFFSRSVTSYSPGQTVPAGPGMTRTTPGVTTTSEVGYFRLDDGPVQRASASNLRSALSDNHASMRALDQYQTLTYAQYGTSAVGAGAFALGAVQTLNSEDNGEYTPSPFLFVGAGVLALSNLIFPSQRKAKVRLAIDVYNE